MKQSEIRAPKMNKLVKTMNQTRNDAIDSFASDLIKDVRMTHRDSITLQELECKVESVRQRMLFQLDIN